jgi:hypothetical protein
MAVKKKKAKKTSSARKAKKAPARKAKKSSSKKTSKRPAKKVAKRPVKKAGKKVSKKATKAVAKKTPAKKAKKTVRKKKQVVGEGDYAASRAFLKDQSGFVEKNKASIPTLGRQAEAALDGPEGDSLRSAEATAAARSRDTF